MAKPVYSPDQSKEIFDTLTQSSDKDASVKELADKFNKTEKSIKLHIGGVDKEKYNEWFKEYEGKLTSATKTEMVSAIMDIIGTGETHRELILDNLHSSSFPKEFTQDIHKQLVTDALRKWDRYFSRQRNKIHNWRLPEGMIYGMLGTLIFFTTNTMVLTNGTWLNSLETPFQKFSWFFVVFFLFLQGIHWYRLDYKKVLEELQDLKIEEEALIEKYKKQIKNIPTIDLDKIYEERWLEQRNLVAEEIKRKLQNSRVSMGMGLYLGKEFEGKIFIGFEEAPQEPQVFGFYDYLYYINSTLIWNRRGIQGIFFRHLDKKIKKSSEWLDKMIEEEKNKKNINLWR